MGQLPEWQMGHIVLTSIQSRRRGVRIILAEASPRRQDGEEKDMGRSD